MHTQEPLVISFYTENTPYQLEALSLIHSCQEWGVELEVEAVPCLGSWQRNCARKPQFILDKLLEKKRPLFWVDVDAVFRKTPDFSWLLGSDASFLDTQDRLLRYRAGSVFVNYTPGGIRFAQAWAAHCHSRRDVTFVDQQGLEVVMAQGIECQFLQLPLAYCKVFDLDASQIDPADVVVEHFQASRRFHWNSL